MKDQKTEANEDGRTPALAVATCSASDETHERFQISDQTGRVLYKNLRKSKEGYDWGDGYGHINAYIIKTESWILTKQTTV